MLDHIYQKAIDGNGIDTFIIFTGDGHFNSVVQFIANRCKKEIGIYGVKNAISNQLKTSASWYTELPNDDYMLKYYRMILENLKRIESSYRRSHATFMKTVTLVAQRNNVDEELIQAALEQLIQKGYILQKREKSGYGKTINVLHADWTRLRRDGIFTQRTIGHM